MLQYVLRPFLGFVASICFLTLMGCPTPSSPSQNNDVSLQLLSISAGINPIPLQPPFNPSITQYRVTVPPGTTSINFSAVPRDVAARIKYESIRGLASDGTTPLTLSPPTPTGISISDLTSGENTLSGTVVAQDGTEQVYQLIINVDQISITLQVAQSGQLVEEVTSSGVTLTFSLENVDLGATGLSISVPLTYDDVGNQVSGGEVNTLTFTSAAPNPTVTLLGRATDDGNTDSETITVGFGTPTITGSYNENYQLVLPDDIMINAIDDDGTAVNAALATGSVTEGATENLVLTLQNPGTESVTVTPTGEGLTFAPATVTLNSTNLTGTIVVTATDNSEDEATRAVSITLESSSPQILVQPNTLNLSVADDDVPAITLAASDSVSEGQPIEGTLTLSPIPYQNVSVGYVITVAGGRTLSDYVASAHQTGSISIPAGQSTVSFSIPTVNNDVDDPVASVPLTLTISNPSPSGAASITTATESIALEDDELTAVSLSSSASRITEERGTVTFSFTLSQALAEATTVRYTVRGLDNSGGSGTTPPDAWTGISTGEATIAAGGTTATITATAQPNDVRATFIQGVVVRLTEAVSSNNLVTINTETQEESVEFIDDEAPVVRIARTANSSTIFEGSTASFTVSLEDSAGAMYTPSNPVTVRYSVGSGNFGATPYADGSDGEDWNDPGSSITIAAGSSSEIIEVETRSNPEDESNETLVLTLNSAQEDGRPVQAHLSENSASYTLVNSPHITITRSSTDAIAEDGGTLTFTLTRDQGTSSSQSIRYAIEGITSREGDSVSALNSSDYSYVDSDGAGTSGDGTVTFAANETSVTITVTAESDDIYEVEQWGRLTLTHPTNHSIFIPEESRIWDFRVADDDEPLILSVDIVGGPNFETSYVLEADVIITVNTPSTVTAVEIYGETYGGGTVRYQLNQSTPGVFERTITLADADFNITATNANGTQTLDIGGPPTSGAASVNFPIPYNYRASTVPEQ